MQAVETEVIQPQQIETIRHDFAVERSLPDTIIERFGPYFKAAIETMAESAKVTVTDATQLTEMKQAKAHRLALKAIRCQADGTRENMKAAALLECNNIQAVFNALRVKVTAEEARLEEAEKFAERAEARRKAEYKAVRTQAVLDVGGNPAIYVLEEMTAEAYAELLASLKRAKTEREEAAAKAEADRIEAENTAKAERAKLQAENARLQAERDAADKAAREAQAKAAKEAAEQRQAAQAAIDAANAAKAKAEKAIADQKAAADKAAREKALADKRAAAAPDKDKLREYVKALLAVPVPTMATDDGRAVLEFATAGLNRLVRDIGQDVQGRM